MRSILSATTGLLLGVLSVALPQSAMAASGGGAFEFDEPNCELTCNFVNADPLVWLDMFISTPTTNQEIEAESYNGLTAARSACLATAQSMCSTPSTGCTSVAILANVSGLPGVVNCN